MPPIPSQHFKLLVRCSAVYLALFSAQLNATAAEVLTASSRTLPAIGTTWCYSIGSSQPSTMTLKGVTAGIARYDIGGPGAITRIEEQTDTYTSVNATRHGQRKLLVFPLAKDRKWSDEFTEDLTSHLGSAAEMEFNYHAISQSHVIGTEKRHVGAGTFDTFVIERNTAWTKSNPRSSSKLLQAQQCGDADCTVTGYSKEVYWYAPSVGRAVLRAYSQSGDSDFVWNLSPDELLSNASSLVTELIGYGRAGTCEDLHPPLLARIPSAPWYGFPLLMNNTWEFLMQRNMAPE
ncbi:hypothetical protein PQR66_30785 [Paraburkholderia agricolaris]|uniref:Uncharacterized protein n=1 Tax=Paraburkholderia agricolaris TaxID=2152888 RepID=A0ABW8ZX69_9BURK|nr:hypothetical protein [Paraburkholderia agricolaris]